MDAFELYNEHGKPTGVWCCGKCRKLTLNSSWMRLNEPKSTREAAEACCQPRICETCGAKDDFDPHRQSTKCQSCIDAQWQAERAERELKRLEAAEDVTDTYDGPVYLEGYSGDMGEGYFTDAEAALDYLHDEELDPPEWAWACKSELKGIDLDRVLENLCDDGYERMADYLEIPAYLQEAVDRWNQENEQALTVWNVDHKRKVRLRARDTEGV